MKPTRELCEAILRIRSYPSFELFLKAIDQAGVDAMLELVDVPPDRVGRLQGRAKLSAEILDLVNNADQYLEKFEKQPRGEDAHGRSTRVDSTASGAF